MEQPKNKERLSERPLTWVAVAVLSANLLGIDLQQMMAMAINADKYIIDLQQHLRGSGINVDTITLPALVGLYTWCRTEIKKKREVCAEVTTNGAE